MDTIRHILAIPLALIALSFLYIGWRRGNRFNFHDYQGNKKERLRDNFFASFTITTAFDCFILITSPVALWNFVVPVMLLLILFVVPVSMLSQYWSSYLARIMTGRKNHVGWLFWQESNEPSILKWYEFTPFAFVAGWVIYCLVYAGLLLSRGNHIFSENVPEQIIFIGFFFDLTATLVITTWLHWRFKISNK